MENPLKPKFLLTSELARLARWLRLLGFDAVLSDSGKTATWARLCSLQNRILLTRARKNAHLKTIKHYLIVVSENHQEQLKQIVRELSLSDFKVFSRCLCCNRAVYTISKDKILPRLPEKVRSREEHFTCCRKCGKIYWKGTHYEAMLQTLNRSLFDIINRDIGGFVLTEFR
jgi:uncharacterized protein